MELIRREDVFDLILAAGANHNAAIREEEEKAAASGVKLYAYAYAINVLATLEAIVHDIPAEVRVMAGSDVPDYTTDPDPCEDEDSTRRAEEEVNPPG